MRRNNYGVLMVMIGIIILLALPVFLFYPSEIRYLPSFLIPGIAAALAGLFLCFFFPRKKAEDSWKYDLYSGSMIVLFAWICGIVFSSFPFVIGGQLTPLRALFEAVSAWTTTGLSVMDVEKVPHVYLYYRGWMQFCGGLGFILIMLTFRQGRKAAVLYSAEGHSDRIRPHLRQTVLMIVGMYFSFLIAGIIAYIIAGMNPLDSIVHSMAALSTGGFSNKAASIGAYNSFPIEIITILIMLAGSVNFAVMLVLVRGKVKNFFKATEVRFLGVLLVIIVPIMALILFCCLYGKLGFSFRESLFNAVSAITTSGFSTVDYNTWPQAAVGIMILLMIIGGGIGSTAGGIKLFRIYIMLNTAGESIRRKLSPNSSVRIRHYTNAQGKMAIEPSLISDTFAFIGLYLTILMAGSIAITALENCPFANGFFEFASSLGTVGLSIGITGPTTRAATLIVEICGMFLGRLEIFIVFIGVHSAVASVARLFRNKKKQPASEGMS
ncbi:MAG TPA: TrkH family potassium uptake protein [Lachnospiraceae bacterium]|nr:TrkH family potassium uptake protein [Lachnospiraceae bacterium]